MPRIFISYRRRDTATITGRIYDRLLRHYPESGLFKDVDKMPPGHNFLDVITATISKTDVMLVIIGPHWIYDEDGDSLFERQVDYVTAEIESAFSNDVLVIPVLVKNTLPPLKDDLPAPLQKLALNHAVTVRDDPDFHRDMDRLVNYLDSLDTPTVTTRTYKQDSAWGTTPILPVASGLLAIIAIGIAVFALFFANNDETDDKATSTPAPVVAVVNVTESPSPVDEATQEVSTETPTEAITELPTEPVIEGDNAADAIGFSGEVTLSATATSRATFTPTPIQSATVTLTTAPGVTPSPITTTPTTMADSDTVNICTGIVVGLREDETLNLRSAPTLAAYVWYKLPPDVELELLASTTDGWLQARYVGAIGWVSTNFIEQDQNCELDVRSLTVSNFPDFCFATNPGVVIREEADETAQEITRINANMPLVIARYDPAGLGWFYVATPNGELGWVASSVAGRRGNCESILEDCIATSIEGSNVRLGGSTSHYQTGFIGVGESRRVIGENSANDGWYQIDTFVGDGWISQSTVRRTGNCGAIPDVEYDPAE